MIDLDQNDSTILSSIRLKTNTNFPDNPPQYPVTFYSKKV